MCEPLKSDEIIPDIVHPLGKYWEQPNRDNILIDDKHALMSKHSLDGLHEYSMSIPTGVYTGKMWKSKVLGKWLLRWFGNENDKGLLPILSREILIREETPMNEPLKSLEEKVDKLRDIFIGDYSWPAAKVIITKELYEREQSIREEYDKALRAAIDAYLDEHSDPKIEYGPHDAHIDWLHPEDVQEAIYKAKVEQEP